MERTKIAWALVIVVLSAFVLLPSQMMAQGLFGTISGVVTDSSGGMVPDATVKVTNIKTSVTITVKTNGTGVYSATSLNPGVYKVEAEAKGFKTAVVNNFPLEVNANPKVDLTLTVGQIMAVAATSIAYFLWQRAFRSKLAAMAAATTAICASAAAGRATTTACWTAAPLLPRCSGARPLLRPWIPSRSFASNRTACRQNTAKRAAPF